MSASRWNRVAKQVLIDHYSVVRSRADTVHVVDPTQTNEREPNVNATVLWIIAAILVVVGIVQLFQDQIILGVVLIVLGCLVGPGGYSLFRSRRT